MKNPHLNESGLDYATGHRHCLECETPVHTPHDTMEGHIALSWTHYRWQEYNSVAATDELGKTIEGEFIVPARRILAPLDRFNSVVYCLECRPFGELDSSDKCPACGLAVDITEEHSVLESLKKYPNGYNGDFTRTFWHVNCQPHVEIRSVT